MTAPDLSSREEIGAIQLSRLQALLAAVAAGNAFYSARLRASGVDSDISSIEEFTRRAPFTTRQELMEDQLAHPPFGSNLTFPLSHYSRFSQTSASTGKPLRWLDTPESWDWMLGNWTRVFQAAGVGPEDRVFFAFSFGPFLGFWTAFEAAARMGCLCLPGGGMRTATRLGLLLDAGATVMCSTPTYAIHMAEVAAQEGIDLRTSRIRTIIVAGEPGGSIPATRRQIETLWPGARVVDHHGMTEMGPVTYGCPVVSGVLHVIESSYVAEVIDPETGRAFSPGNTGELILTNLGRTGSPLLRYRTSDVVRPSPSGRCACGSFELALEGGILSRTDDMVVVRGVNVFPGAIEEIIRSGGGVAEYRVRISGEHALVEMSIDVEPAPESHRDNGLAHRLQVAMHRALSLRVPVVIVPPGTLPRFEMKAKRWIRTL